MERVHTHFPPRMRPLRRTMVLAPCLPSPLEGPTRSYRILAVALAVFSLLFILAPLHAQVAINATGTPPASNAMLDVNSTTLGILAPRVLYTEKLAVAVADGLIIYQTDSFGLEPKGYYYYDASTLPAGWRHVGWGPVNWQLGGNAGTNPATDFLGTLNLQPLMLRTNNNEHGRITPTGELQLYPTGPAGSNEKVEVVGALKLNGGYAGNTPGAIRFVPASGSTPAKFQGYVSNAPTSDSTMNGWKQLDNSIKERKNQQSPVLGSACALPSSLVNPLGGPRPWPISGPANGTAYGPDAPYYSFWEDSHRQYLYRGSDLAPLGMCPGYPITAISFFVNGIDYSGGWDLHFLRFSMKNTVATTTAVFDNNSLTTFATPNTGPYPGAPGSASWHVGGYHVNNGWNVHPWDQGGLGGFYWSGGNLLIDAAVDNQDWPARAGDVDSYPSGYQSMISMFCDACGGTGANSCTWTVAPTMPTDGTPGAGSTVNGWGWTSGWFLTNGANTITCDGTFAYSGGGPASVTNKLPRVAFYCQYIGGGATFNLSNYMYAQDGVMIGTAAWAAGTAPYKFRGPGTISAQKSVWSNSSLLSDYVFDLYYDHKVQPEDAANAADYRPTPLKALPDYLKEERHLPTISGRDEWRKEGTFSVDKLGNQIWVTVEQQALYIKELNERMDALQQFLVDKKLKELGDGKK